MSDPARQASVVIPSHGGAMCLPKILAPLLADPGTREVVVVADRDEEVERAVHLLSHSAVRCVPSDAGSENGARQAGVEAAEREVVVLLDDDVLAHPGLVSRHLSHDHRRRAVLGYMPVEPRRLRGIGRFPVRAYGANYEEAVEQWERSPDRILELFWAGNFSALRQDLLEVGIANPQFRGLYHADEDLGLRLRDAGFSAAFDRQAAAWHLYERSARAYVHNCRRQGAIRGLDGPAVRAPTRLERLSARACLAGAFLAGALHHRRAERHLLWRMRLVEHRFGAHAAQTGRAESLGLLMDRG
jgi:GT2 family glycosyltransferase